MVAAAMAAAELDWLKLPWNLVAMALVTFIYTARKWKELRAEAAITLSKSSVSSGSPTSSPSSIH